MAKTTHAKVSAPPIGGYVVVATFALNIFALALPLVMLQIFDRVIPNESHNTLLMLFVGMIVITLLEFAQRWARIVLLGHAGRSYELALSQEFMRKVLLGHPDDIKKGTIATWMDSFGAVTHLRSYYAGQNRLLAIELPFVIIFIGMIALIGGWLVLVPLVGIVVLLAFRAVLKRSQTEIFDKRNSLDSRRHSFLFEVLSQVTTAKTNAMERQLLRRYQLLQDQTVDISERLIHFSGFSQTFGALFSQLAVGAMGLLGAYLIIDGRLVLAELAACMLLNGRTIQPLLKALNVWSQSESISSSRSKANKALDLPLHHRPPNMSHVIKGAIKFESVCLTNPLDGSAILEKFDLDLKKSAFLALKGRSRDEISQVFRLLLGEVQADSGSIRIDKRPIGSFENSLGEFGIVCAEKQPIKLPGSIFDNLTAFENRHRSELAQHFARELLIEDFVYGLRNGYNTVLAESNEIAKNPTVLIRIGIARALVLQPKILLLEDVTSGLDPISVRAIVDTLTLQKGKMTIIYNGSDPALLALADQVINLHADEPNHSALFSDDGSLEMFDLDQDAA